MEHNTLSLIIGGYAGQGVKTLAQTFARICSRAGFQVFLNQEYPSNIRGEHNHFQVMVSGDWVGAHTCQANVLLALDAKTVNLHIEEIASGGALVFDREGIEVSPVDEGMEVGRIKRGDIAVLDIPFKQIAKEVGGSGKAINSVGLGSLLGLLGLDFDPPADVLRQSLSKLANETVQQNVDGARRAYDITRDEYSGKLGMVLGRREAPDRMLISGNDAVAMGALKAGLKFYSSYPMSPASGVLNFLSKRARDYGLVALLTEDEISAAGMAIGASFAGVRAMTGTSGGGFCLMAEFLGLAGMAEIPLVILEGQRPGPATGLPTRTEQGDLSFVLSAHQGDFPRLVIAPGDPAEAFELTFDAFNLADRYQTPVIVLTDKHLAESFWTYEPFDTGGMTIDRGQYLGEKELSEIRDYKRFLLTEPGISPRTRPGIRGGVFRATGNEHNEYGRLSEEADDRTAQVDKRLRKTAGLDVSHIGARLHGDPDAQLTVVGWGSTKWVILEAIALLKTTQNINCNFLQIIYLEPFPTSCVTEVIRRAKRTALVENNATGQLGDLIRQKTGFTIQDRILKYNGRQFCRDELAELILKRLQSPAPGSRSSSESQT